MWSHSNPRDLANFFLKLVRNFKIPLVSDWQSFSYTDAIGRYQSRFMFRNQSQGSLEITRESLSGRTLSNKVDDDFRDIEHCYTCLFTEKEAFTGGQLSGSRIIFYHVKDGRRVVGLYYYLQDGDTVWILRFSGNPDSAGLARQITDKMARSFSPSPSMP